MKSLKQIFKEAFENLKGLINNPVKLIPTLVLSVIWMAFSMMSAFGVNVPAVRFLSTLTYARGGMFGGVFGMIGGIFGKAMFAYCVTMIVNSIVSKTNPFKNIKAGFKSAFVGMTSSGLVAIAPVVIGAGISIIIYWFLNTTSSLVNIAASVAGLVVTLKVLCNKSGLIGSLIFTILGKLSKGKTPSQATVSRVLTGMAAGFTIGFALTFIRIYFVLLLSGVVVLALGIIFSIVGGNGVNKASTAALIMIVSVSLSLVCGITINAADGSFSYDDYEYVRYNGYLTYTNGSVNKYGQPFPDIMDFDRDGDIDYNDMAIRQKLVHNPDYLNFPDKPIDTVVISVITAILGGFVGEFTEMLAVAAESGVDFGPSTPNEDTTKEEQPENEEEVPEEPVPEIGPSLFIYMDSDGDLTIIDPITGEESVYIDIGNGTYKNILTDAEATMDEIKDRLESRIENADVLSQDAAVAERAKVEQREANQGLSKLSQELIREEHERMAAEEEAEKRDKYLEKLWDKYGVHNGNEDELREKMAQQQMENEIASYENEAMAEEWKKSEDYASKVQTAADIGVDALATYTGNTAIKEAYVVTKNFTSRLTDAYINDKNMGAAVAMGALDSLADLTLDKVEGKGFHITGNVGTDVFKKVTDNIYNGKDWKEGIGTAAAGGLLKGGLAKGLAKISNAATKTKNEQLLAGLKDVNRAYEKGFSQSSIDALKYMNTLQYAKNLHAETVVNTAVTVGTDIGKTTIDGVSQAIQDNQEAMKK
ncbi:MAG: hypothetical protein MJ236_02690 [Clostridia bacterium]|nr:hypothetical protein [Clostridia bacterium]